MNILAKAGAPISVFTAGLIAGSALAQQSKPIDFTKPMHGQIYTLDGTKGEIIFNTQDDYMRLTTKSGVDLLCHPKWKKKTQAAYQCGTQEFKLELSYGTIWVNGIGWGYKELP